MRPILFSLGHIHLYGYGAMIVLGGFLACGLLYLHSTQLGLNNDDDFWLLVNSILLGGFVGGRVLYVLEYTKLFSSDFWSSLFAFGRGFSVLGAFLGVPFCVWLMCQRRGLNFFRVFDGVCTVAPLWHSFGRLGCFFAGCCYGRPTDKSWGIIFSNPSAMISPSLLGVRVHPTQLYEAFGNLIIALILYRMWIKLNNRMLGFMIASYFTLYSFMRFFEEFYRGDVVSLAFGLTAAQVIALFMFCPSLIWILWRMPCFRHY